MRNSIRARMTAAFSLFVAVLVFTASLLLIYYAQYSAIRSASALLESTARTAAFEFNEFKSSGGVSAFMDEEREELEADNLMMVIVDSRGHVIAQSHKKIPFWPIKNDGKWKTTYVSVDGNRIYIGMPWQGTQATLEYHGILLLILSVFVVIITTLGAWFLVGHTLSPIASLSRQANTASTDKLRLTLSEPSRDAEIVELVATLNGLLQRLSETAALKGKFYSAASHELRTPLQALSGHLELALSRDRTCDEYKSFIEEAHRQADRLMSLVRDLLLLYQLDSAAERPSPQSVDICDVCRHSLVHLEPLVKDRNLIVNYSIPESMTASVPTSHIEILIRNLSENAIKYTPEGGNIDVSIKSDAGSIRFEIVNDCIVNSDFNTQELFEPFFRPDSSRDTRTGGTGLGLAICKSIADTNDWELAMSCDEARFRMVLEIPNQ